MPLLPGLVAIQIAASVVNIISGLSRRDESFRFTSCFLAALDSLILALSILHSN